MQNQFSPKAVPLEQCEAFCDWKSPRTIERFVRRDQLPLPTWFVPSAHGGAIVAPSFLSKLGYCPSCFIPRGWQPRTKLDGYIKWLRSGRRLVRRCDDLFSVECSLSKTLLRGGVLIWQVGAIPVFTSTPQEAMFLLQLEVLPSDFRWVELCPSTNAELQFQRVTSMSLHPPQAQAQRRSGVSLSRRLLNSRQGSCSTAVQMNVDTSLDTSATGHTSMAGP